MGLRALGRASGLIDASLECAKFRASVLNLGAPLEASSARAGLRPVLTSPAPAQAWARQGASAPPPPDLDHPPWPGGCSLHGPLCPLPASPWPGGLTTAFALNGGGLDPPSPLVSGLCSRHPAAAAGGRGASCAPRGARPPLCLRGRAHGPGRGLHPEAAGGYRTEPERGAGGGLFLPA